MKALRLKGPGRIALEEIPIPEISDAEVLIEVKYCGICGSDIHAFRVPEVFPAGAFLGHELSGVVVKVGDKIKDREPGDRVTVSTLYRCGECYACKHALWSSCPRAFEAIGVMPDQRLPGGFAKYVRVPYPEYELYALPDEVSFEEGALVDPLADGLHAVRISSFKPGDYTIVLGCGPIGLGVISFLRYGGAGLIIATRGKNKKRGEVAMKLGADHVFCPAEVPDLKEKVLQLTDGVGVDVVFECSGKPEAFQSAPSFLRPRGQVILVGLHAHEVPVVPLPFTLYEYSLQGSFCYYHDEFPMVMEFLKRRLLPVNEIITSKIKLRDIVKKGFDVLTSPGHDKIKIIVEPDD